MENNQEYNMHEKNNFIVNELYKLIESAIEREYNMDKFNNLVYKDGGKKRAANRINVLIKEWGDQYDISTEEIIIILKKAFQSISETCVEEGKEIINILSEIEEKEKMKEEMKKAYTKEER